MDLFLLNGLVQFGRFQSATGGMLPFNIQIEALPSFPDVVVPTVEVLSNRLRDVSFEFILCNLHSAPLGSVLAIKLNKPMVYSQGSAEAVALDLVGIYNINHPTLAFTLVMQDPHKMDHFYKQVNRVGLKVKWCMTLLRIFPRQSTEAPEWDSLFSLEELTQRAVKLKLITESKQRRVLEWIDQHAPLAVGD